MQYCTRCGRAICEQDPRDVIHGKVYDLYCGTKTKREENERDNQVRKREGNSPRLPGNGV